MYIYGTMSFALVSCIVPNPGNHVGVNLPRCSPLPFKIIKKKRFLAPSNKTEANAEPSQHTSESKLLASAKSTFAPRIEIELKV